MQKLPSARGTISKHHTHVLFLWSRSWLKHFLLPTKPAPSVGRRTAQQTRRAPLLSEGSPRQAKLYPSAYASLPQVLRGWTRGFIPSKTPLGHHGDPEHVRKLKREGAGTLKGRQVKSHWAPRPRHEVGVGTKVPRGRARVPFFPASRSKPFPQTRARCRPCPRPSTPLVPAVPGCGRLRKAGNASLTTYTSMSNPGRHLRPPTETRSHTPSGRHSSGPRYARRGVRRDRRAARRDRRAARRDGTAVPADGRAFRPAELKTVTLYAGRT